MNQKKAKLLRKLAKNIFKKSQDENSSSTAAAQYVENEQNRKIETMYKTDKSTGQIVFDQNGFPIIQQRFHVADGTISLAKGCLKDIYNTLKKNA